MQSSPRQSPDRIARQICTEIFISIVIFSYTRNFRHHSPTRFFCKELLQTGGGNKMLHTPSPTKLCFSTFSKSILKKEKKKKKEKKRCTISAQVLHMTKWIPLCRGSLNAAMPPFNPAPCLHSCKSTAQSDGFDTAVRAECTLHQMSTPSSHQSPS